MLLIRRFEELVIKHYPEQEMKTPVHLCVGQEAIAAGICAHLTQNDYLFTTHRNHGHCLAKGMHPQNLLAEFYGKATGCAGGKGGSMHPVDKDLNILGTTAIVGGGIPIAVGTAWAEQMKGSNDIAAVFFGDGASEEGTFHESLNFAALKNIPVLFVCENNMYATASPISKRQAKQSSIADKAASYGIPGICVNGNNVMDVYEVAKKAVERARNNHGATLIEATTYRWYGHVGPNDDTETGHRPARELEQWKKRCPLKTYRDDLYTEKLLDKKVDKKFTDEIDHRLQEALQFAQESEQPAAETLLKNVFVES